MTESVTIVECPRDAWPGLRQIIPTEEKIKYLSSSRFRWDSGILMR